MKKVFEFLKGGLKGVFETTLIPSLIKEGKKLTSSGAQAYLDVNGDGRINWKDVEALQWQTLGKLLGVILVLWLALKLDVLTYLDSFL
jgi:hypothetical protein